MSELSLPWLEISILLPLLGAVWVARARNPAGAHFACSVTTGATFFCAAGEWIDFALSSAKQADDRWRLMTKLFGHELFAIDTVNAPLFALVALLYFLTTLSTVSVKIRRFSFARALLSEAIALAGFSCVDPWGVIVALSLGTAPVYWELRARKKSTRVYALHMVLFVSLLVLGWSFVEAEGGGDQRVHSWHAVLPLLLAILIRGGMAPFHCWVTDLFEHATFGTAILFVAPIAGAFAATRLLLPIAEDWVLRGMGVVSLATAVYSAGMALIQRDARRFCCYLFLSHSALVLSGLEMVSPIGLTGALCVWLSAGLSLGGLGLTLRALESRRGRLSLAIFQGHYDHTPNLAMCFALTGLASVGFPGTLGFIGTELLVDGAIHVYPHFGIAVIVAAALNGIAIVRAYFQLFAGTQYFSSVSLMVRARERYAVLALAALLLIGGLIPQANVSARHEAAEELLKDRKTLEENVAVAPSPESRP